MRARRWSWSELTFLEGNSYRVRDLWSRKDIGYTTTNYVGELNWHDVAVFRLTPLE